MAEPRPLRTVLLLELVGVCCLGLWWLSRPLPERVGRLAAIAVEEHAKSLPPGTLTGPAPLGMLAQVQWLVRHRVDRLHGVLVLVAVVGLIGIAQGLAQRRRDGQAGFRLQAWTVGLVGGVLLPGLVAAAVLLPVVLPLWGYGVVLAGWLGGVGYLVSWGRPSVP